MFPHREKKRGDRAERGGEPAGSQHTCLQVEPEQPAATPTGNSWDVPEGPGPGWAGGGVSGGMSNRELKAREDVSL